MENKTFSQVREEQWAQRIASGEKRYARLDLDWRSAGRPAQPQARAQGEARAAARRSRWPGVQGALGHILNE